MSSFLFLNLLFNIIFKYFMCSFWGRMCIVVDNWMNRVLKLYFEDSNERFYVILMSCLRGDYCC